MLKNNQNHSFFHQKVGKNQHFFNIIFAVFKPAKSKHSNIKNCDFIFAGLLCYIFSNKIYADK